MNIVLLGYGRMGKMVEDIALNRQHTIVGKIGRKTKVDSQQSDFANTDVAIDFSTPDSAPALIKRAIRANIPVISGTTGWLDVFEETTDFVKSLDGALLYASNFSIGVNLFFKLNRQLAKLMGEQSQYNVEMTEIHHKHKRDAPSGTAISLAEGIIQENPGKSNWINKSTSDPKLMSIHSIRESEVPGTHRIVYSSADDAITIEHQAFNRQGFALGAVLAAEWLIGKKGIFTMEDVLGLE